MDDEFYDADADEYLDDAPDGASKICSRDAGRRDVFST
jgi:hypothetical protein